MRFHKADHRPPPFFCLSHHPRGCHFSTKRHVSLCVYDLCAKCFVILYDNAFRLMVSGQLSIPCFTKCTKLFYTFNQLLPAKPCLCDLHRSTLLHGECFWLLVILYHITILQTNIKQYASVSSANKHYKHTFSNWHCLEHIYLTCKFTPPSVISGGATYTAIS